MTLFRLAGVYFLLTFAVGFVLGCIRVPLLEPRLGIRTAELLEMPFMLAAIFLSARWSVRRFGSAASARTCLRAGILAMSGILLADIVVGVGIRGMTVAGVFTERDPVSGGAYYLALVVFAVMPWLMRRKGGSGIF